MDGILLVDKPSGWTSFDAVAKVRGMAKRETGIKRFKVGHTGTLDPLATGLLVLVLGKYTKKVPELSKADKIYDVTMKLGETSTTGDEEGEKTRISDEIPTKEAIEAALGAFRGEIEQIPPKYSAIKINGQRAYKLARAGKEVAIEPRKTTIYDISNVSYEYPLVKFTAKVSSGTYIRTLVEDIGQNLATGAYMPALRRTQVGEFKLADAARIEDLTSENLSDFLKK